MSAYRFVTISQAAAYLGVHPRTVRRYLASRKLITYRIGDRLIRLDLNNIDEMMSEAQR